MVTLLNNNFPLTSFIVLIASLAGFILLIFGIIQMSRGSNIVNQRMQVYAGEAEKATRNKEIVYIGTQRELSGSVFSRTITPFFQKIFGFLGKFTPSNSIDKLNADLRVAGNPYGMRAQEYYGVRVLFIFLGIGLAFLMNFRNGFTNFRSALLGGLIILLALYIPRIWLNARIRDRKDELSHNLPDVLDMLSVCASAGLSFDQAIKKICEYWHNALSDEFEQMLQEMEMGVPRAEALRNLGARVNVNELSSFVAIMNQADSTGMSYAEMLLNQAKQLRIFRQLRAKEKANTLPAKMILPVALFIFPALIMVILGPLIPRLLTLFNNL